MKPSIRSLLSQSVSGHRDVSVHEPQLLDKAVHSKQSVHMIGALGDGALDLQFYDDLSAGSYVELVKHLRRRYGKVGIIADNASALTGRAM